MDVQIGEIASTVRLTEGSDHFTERIVQRVLAILADRIRQEQDAARERRVGTGVRDDQEREE